ncbi:DEAD/DEAH box helicase [Occallatibacter riparius]|uniref:DEAD/DEAH box helicase n=1 Tax=Occallatibacter riparius TaxID=1002689 RepID=A0A9J7BG98_9BACT|nr:DEAD/DEAH box helicase [Occallatibacter riparius]UWZ81808.1 DEAD/DEAH box helicase [Occallatibacter riparius]
MALILRKDMTILREQVIVWFSDAARSDDQIAARLLDPEDEFDTDDAVVIAATNAYVWAIGTADSGLLFGNRELFQSAIDMLRRLIAASSQSGQLSTWWVATLTLHLLEDLWDSNLHQRLPQDGPSAGQEDWPGLRTNFIAQMSVRRPPQMELWPSQLEAAKRAIDLTDDLVIALPTSAGKTRIAELCILCTLASRKRVVYVTPLRALSAQVERVLSRSFVPLGFSVTSLYGAAGATIADSQTLASANIVVATPEKLDFAMRQDPAVLDDVGLIVFDEGHMIGLGSRELRYEALVQKLLRRGDAQQRRIVCLSAMFNSEDPYFEDFTKWLRSDDPGAAVQVSWRPTRQRLATLDWATSSESARLNFREEEAFVPNFVKIRAAKGRRRKKFPDDEAEFHVATVDAFAGDGHSILVYCPIRRQTESLAKAFLQASKQGYLEHIRPLAPSDFEFAAAIGREWLGKSHCAYSALEAGIGVHHGALPRPFLSAIEQLLHQRKLSVVIASPTLAQGLDLSCSVLVFRSLQRYEQGQWKCIPEAEFSNVLGRVGRAFVDLDGIAVLPSFDASKRDRLHKDFSDLIEASTGQRLVSGLARLVMNLVHRIASLLGVQPKDFSEYILNNPTLWDDPRLSGTDDEEDDETEATTQRLSADLADLDVAILSTIDQLGADVTQITTLLDEMLNGSLWRRTLNRHNEPTQSVERNVLISRATWLWNRTSAQQRSALYASGLGTEPGLFLDNHRDELIDSLAELHSAFIAADAKLAGAAAVRFAKVVLGHPFFGVRTLPESWETALHEWIAGVPSAEILKDRTGHDANRIQVFLQDAISFKLVWAAEAVRVQAIAVAHPRFTELGEGPALAFTYGVSSQPAALLCQLGLASRTAAVWATEKATAQFKDIFGAKLWLSKNEQLLAQKDFWDTEDQYLLWNRFVTREDIDSPRGWKHLQMALDVQWNGIPLPSKTFVRIIPKADGTGMVCNSSLWPVGRISTPFDCTAWHIEAATGDDGRLLLNLYGPATHALN